ncbi:MAG TPA: serine hydrolase domain-containing protein [Gaiellales bacterium]|nr:serine hydrolase domain-containing protein [Gaiellales bacterium]
MAIPLKDLAEELEARARAFVREHRLPGVAAAVVHGDDLMWASGEGYADVAGSRRPDTRTLYRVASVTKTFTGTAIVQLRDAGRLHLDDPAVSYIPELASAGSPFAPIETLTIRRMLSHESGLMGDPPGTDWSYRTYPADVAEILGRVDEAGLRIPVNVQQKYSNLAYELLGEIVARVSGQPYPEYLRERILQPLALDSTAFEPLSEKLAARCAVGYAPRAFSDELLPARPLKSNLFAAGGLWSCVEDLARWISFQLRETDGDDGKVLSRASLHEMQRPRYLGDEGWTEAWGVAWYATRREDVTWVMHSGGLFGFASNVCFDPAERVGAIALVNGHGPADALAMELAAMARASILEHPLPIEPPQPLPVEWQTLLGLYADPDVGILLRLEWRDGKLTFVDPDDPGWRPVLRPTDVADEFVVELGVRQSGEPCTFERRTDGRVRAVVLGPATLVRLDPVE